MEGTPGTGGRLDISNDAFYAEGDHCQYVYVDPRTETVIARNGAGCGDLNWPELFGNLSAWLAENLD